MSTSPLTEQDLRTIPILGKNRHRPVPDEQIPGTEFSIQLPPLPPPAGPALPEEEPCTRPSSAPPNCGIAAPELVAEPEPSTLISERPPAPPEPEEPEVAVAVAEEEVAPAIAQTACPRCGGKLINPESLGWCMACGYCRSTAEDAPKVEAADQPATPQPSALGMVECFQLVRTVPAWAWLTCSGVGLMILVSLAVDGQFPELSRARAVWCTAQIAISFSLLVLAQLWAMLILAPIDERLGAKDAIIPFKLWTTCLKHGSKARWPLLLGASALTLLVCAFAVIGGLSYWLPAPPPRKAMTAPTAPALVQGTTRTSDAQAS